MSQPDSSAVPARTRGWLINAAPPLLLLTLVAIRRLVAEYAAGWPRCSPRSPLPSAGRVATEVDIAAVCRRYRELLAGVAA